MNDNGKKRCGTVCRHCFKLVNGYDLRDVLENSRGQVDELD